MLQEGAIEAMSISPKLCPISIKYEIRIQGMKRVTVEFEILVIYDIIITSR